MKGLPPALRVPDFRRLWLAGLISTTGDWLLLVSLPILVYQLTGSTLGTAVAFLVELGPPVLLGPLAGQFADRYDRRRTLLAVSLAQAVALLPLLAVHGRGQLGVVYAVIGVQSALVTLFQPAKNALLPTLVPADQLVSANSLVGLNENLGRLVGGPLGGALLAVGSLGTIVAADTVSFLAAALLIYRLHAGRPAARPGTGSTDGPPGGGASGGLRAALRPPAVRVGLLVAVAAGAAQGIFVVLFVVFVARALHGDAGEIGLLRGVQAIGAIAGAVLLATVRRGLSPPALAASAAAVFGLLDFAIWNSPQWSTALPLYLVLFIVVGVPGVAMATGLVSTLQQASPDRERGRVFGALDAAANLGAAAGMLSAGVLGDRLGLLTVLNGQAALYLVTAGLAALWLTRRYAPRPAVAAELAPADQAAASGTASTPSAIATPPSAEAR